MFTHRIIIIYFVWFLLRRSLYCTGCTGGTYVLRVNTLKKEKKNRLLIKHDTYAYFPFNSCLEKKKEKEKISQQRRYTRRAHENVVRTSISLSKK